MKPTFRRIVPFVFALIFCACAGDPVDATSADSSTDASTESDGASTSPSPVTAVSRSAVHRVQVNEGIVYGRGLRRPSQDAPGGRPMDLLLDVYAPETESSLRRPIIFLVHGGGFATGSRRSDEVVTVANFFAERGWVVFNVDYRLADHHGPLPTSWPSRPIDAQYDEIQWPALYPAARDVKAALRWVHTNAADYNANPDYITAIGGSAGGMLVAMVGFSDAEDYRDEIAETEDSTLATTNLQARSDVRTSIVHWGSQGLLDALQLIDNQNRFDSDDPPVLITHGRMDSTVPFSRGEELRESCDAAGINHEFVAFDGDHGAWNVVIEGQSLNEIARDFIIGQQALTTE